VTTVIRLLFYIRATNIAFCYGDTDVRGSRREETVETILKKRKEYKEKLWSIFPRRVSLLAGSVWCCQSVD
jgi:hypothetical protein